MILSCVEEFLLSTLFFSLANAGPTRPALKRLPLDDVISDATPEKTRKIEVEEDGELDVSDARASQSLVDSSIVILDESTEPKKEVVEVDLTTEDGEGKVFDESPQQKSPSLLNLKKSVSYSSDARSR